MTVLAMILLVTLGLAGVSWRVFPRRVTFALVALTITGLSILGIASAMLEPQPAGRDSITLFLGLTGLLAVFGGGPVTAAVFTLVDGPDAAQPASMASAGTVLRGGTWIGCLERAAVYGTLVAGWPEGVAIVLGLKGLGRYPELRNQEHTGTAERFIIGTFTSVLWAAGCAMFVRLLF